MYTEFDKYTFNIALLCFSIWGPYEKMLNIRSHFWTFDITTFSHSCLLFQK